MTVNIADPPHPHQATQQGEEEVEVNTQTQVLPNAQQFAYSVFNINAAQAAAWRKVKSKQKISWNNCNRRLCLTLSSMSDPGERRQSSHLAGAVRF